MSSQVRSQVVVVTGAGRGLGRAIAEALIREGHGVVALVRSAEQRPELTADLGSSVQVVVRDVADPSAPQEAVDAALRTWGRLTGLVNNAGTIDPMALFASADFAEWERALDVNLLAPARFMRAFVAALARDPGRIVNISSGAAHRPLRGWSAYCTSKAGLAMLTRAVQLEYAESGLRCFNLVPGLIDTGMQASIRAADINEVSRLPKEALRPAHEPAAAVAYLLSGQADDLAGQDVEIRDAGFRSRVGLPLF
jgi:NAD(P)-dependent dehydrogenase (short-subunit alcohol dehydrogenase family)